MTSYQGYDATVVSASSGATRAREATEKTVDAWKKGVQKVTEQASFGEAVAEGSPQQVINRVFDFADKLLEAQREFAKGILEINERLMAPARGNIESINETIRAQTEAVAESSRQQAERIIIAASEQASALIRAAQEQNESLLRVARTQAEQILSSARMQASGSSLDGTQSRKRLGDQYHFNSQVGAVGTHAYAIVNRISPPDIVSSEQEIVVYIDTDDEKAADEVFSAVDELSSLLGFNKPVVESLERGSFFRTAKAQVQAGLSSDAVQDRLMKVERAVELAVLGERQAEVDDKTATAIQRIITSLANIPQACMRVGSLLIVKFDNGNGPVILTRNLTSHEIRALERYPEIQAHPRVAISALAAAVESMEVAVDQAAAP